MESPVTLGQRSTNTTPHHHFYEYRQSPSNELQYHFRSQSKSPRGDQSYIRNSAEPRRLTPRLCTPSSNYSSSGRKNCSRTYSPSIHSSGDGSNVLQDSKPTTSKHSSPSLLYQQMHGEFQNAVSRRNLSQSPGVNTQSPGMEIARNHQQSPPDHALDHPVIFARNISHSHMHQHQLFHSHGHSPHHDQSINSVELMDDPHCLGRDLINDPSGTPHQPRMNSSSSSGSGGTHMNSITPPNSNSNTTISCGSGNSTSANLGAPAATPNISTLKLSNNDNLNDKRKLNKTDTENIKNTEKVNNNVGKKSILEEDCEQGTDNISKRKKKLRSSGVGRVRTSWVGPNLEFLPICDALFNVISLALYFCDIVFDILTAYTWYKISKTAMEEQLIYIDADTRDISELEDLNSKEALWHWSIVAMFFIFLSTFLCQTLSFKWYVENKRRGLIGPDGVELEGPDTPCSKGVLVAMHVSLCGVLWRYFKLFIPVDLRFVKNEVRDLCLLRLVHAFCEAIPMLLMQLYLIWKLPGPEEVSDFIVVSTSLSLCSVCWALASFSKNVRKINVYKLVLTWLGVIFQFLWHLGTVVSRVVALTLYASVYQFYVVLVLVLHWLCMLSWLISPKNLYHGEKVSTSRKMMHSMLIAVVYTFCYVNVQERNSRKTVVVYYVTMFLENSLLLGVWLLEENQRGVNWWYRDYVVIAVFGGFFMGIFFMCLYYRYFHLKRLSYVLDKASLVYRSGSSALSASADPSQAAKHKKESNGQIKATPSRAAWEGKNATDTAKMELPSNVPGAGVFNCRFHPAMKRKKKKPTTFVPPPAVQQQHQTSSPILAANNQQEPQNVLINDSSEMRGFVGQRSNAPSNIGYVAVDINGDGQPRPQAKGRMSQPFWKRPPQASFYAANDVSLGVDGRIPHPMWKRPPLSVTMGSENEGSVCSRVDIHQKLQEKKQQQLAELREIEEEIKAGKLKRPPGLNEIPEPVTARQQIPVEKKQPWFQNYAQHGADLDLDEVEDGRRFLPFRDPNSNEVILSAQQLMMYGDEYFYATATPEWDANFYEPVYENGGFGVSKNRTSKESIYKSYRIASDIDSQMSLPRSYTLPREFKYKRKFRKPVKAEQFLPSTNSSDGDVDSGGDDEVSEVKLPYPLPSAHPLALGGCPSAPQPSKRIAVGKRHKLHETKL